MTDSACSPVGEEAFVSLGAASSDPLEELPQAAVARAKLSETNSQRDR
ncbi:MAG: hypothetical protein HKN03_01195 [Acidimicrobiales bacterium]|nr:hypothetical protein [Acidimicrobiales bacterium]